MEIWIIFAATGNQGIGLHNKIPWNYKDDLMHFKRTTIGNAIIMGRKTYESIGRPLPSRYNIVVSSKSINNVKTVHSIVQNHEMLNIYGYVVALQYMITF